MVVGESRHECWRDKMRYFLKKLAAGGLLLKNTRFLRAKKNSCMYFLLEKKCAR
jgi:hypothetical protein